MVNASQCRDQLTKIEKVAVVMTLPSGVNKNDCEIILSREDDSGVPTEVVVKVPWSCRFLDGKSIFWSRDVNQAYGMHPETIDYEDSINSFRLNDDNVPKAIYTMELHIPVQTNPMTIISVERSFNPVFGGDKNNSMQKVLIIRLTGLRDNFASKHTVVGTTYESD